MHLRKTLAIVTVSWLACIPVFSQKTDPPFLKYINHPWVDSVMKTLTPERKIAQSVWLAAFSNGSIYDEAALAATIEKVGPGGLVFFQGTPEKQAELTGFYQKKSAIPMLIAMDAEWGVGMRLSGIDKFPYQMTLGAIRNDSLILKLGLSVGEQCHQAGINVNLAPVADINNNAANPVINYRSFGEDRSNVAVKASLYMLGMQSAGIMATAKHFPGHGDTDIDSHLDLPAITKPIELLDSLELFPFKRLINDGIACVMTAHLNLPGIDTVKNRPATLSPIIIKGLLKEKLGFNGLVITDAMNMKGVTKYYRAGEAEALAYLAGNDVIEYVTDPSAAIKEIGSLLSQGKITQAEVDQKCRKILAMKYASGLAAIKTKSQAEGHEGLNNGLRKSLIESLYANALTLLSNENNIIPVGKTATKKIASVMVGKAGNSVFQSRINDYFTCDNYNVDPADTASASALLRRLKGYDLVIAGVFGLDQRPANNFGVSFRLTAFLNRLTAGNRCIITWFGNPYGISRVKSLESAPGLLLAYQENDYTEDLSAQLIFGGIGARGSLPVTINKRWPYDFGLVTPGNLRVRYGIPEDAGISSARLERKVDSIALHGISIKAFPGCEVVIARKGIVVFRKCYGFHEYDDRISVRDGDLYDLASVTKISSTLPSLMLLDSEGKFSVDETLGHYLPYFRKSNKGDLKMKEILTHQAGLKAWIPYWKETVKKDGEFKNHIYSSSKSGKYPLQVAEGLYISGNFRKTILRDIRKSPVSEKKYLYSDLGFILAPQIIESLSNQKWYEFVTDSVYKKIGAGDIVFNPLGKYPLNRIVPTEYDSLFRKQLLHGTVHDEGAAMLGGISGHAGLFASGNDMMKLMELYRRMGSYAGEQVISREVMERYTSVQFPENGNRRGLGFDKPLIGNSMKADSDAYPCKGATPSSFGHSGYTGTFVWVDPEKGISFVFLTNRVYPTRNNTLITDQNIRTNILQAVYDSIVE